MTDPGYTPVYPVDYVNALHAQIVALQQSFAQQEAELVELRERDRVLSQQLDRRAGGRDAFTQTLLSDLDAAMDRERAAVSALAALRLGIDTALNITGYDDTDRIAEVAECHERKLKFVTELTQTIQLMDGLTAAVDDWKAKYEEADRTALTLVEWYETTCEQKHRLLRRIRAAAAYLDELERCDDRCACRACDHYLAAAITALDLMQPWATEETDESRD